MTNLRTPDLTLEALGWTSSFADHFQSLAAKALVPARVAVEYNHIYRLYTPQGEVLGEVAGRLRHDAESRRDLPVVGDWVTISLRAREKRASIHGILPRKSKFSRKVAGKTTEEQVVAANIDTIFLVSDFDNDFNTRRLERYLLLIWNSGASPVIILNKADLQEDVHARIREVETTAPGLPVHAISARENRGMGALTPYLETGQTVALLGSSGVGKSTIINRLLGTSRLRTREVRRKGGRGRHATIHRELIILPGGGLIVDTPGMRELQLWGSAESLRDTFEDIEAIAADCHFRDCRHQNEPRCAVRRAVADGTLSAARLESFKKLQKEWRHLAIKQDQRAQLAEKKRWRSIHKLARDYHPRG